MFTKLAPLALAIALGVLAGERPAHAATVVALGASNTFGKGVSRDQAYPAQLAARLRARGIDVGVANAGINGDTTGGMLARLDRAVSKDTRVVLLQPGGNDQRKGASDETSAIRDRLNARGIRVVMVPNRMFAGKPHQSDGVHLTPEGYRLLAEQLVDDVAGALAR